LPVHGIPEEESYGKRYLALGAMSPIQIPVARTEGGKLFSSNRLFPPNTHLEQWGNEGQAGPSQQR
jgi:hypothetical protein